MKRPVPVTIKREMGDQAGLTIKTVAVMMGVHYMTARAKLKCLERNLQRKPTLEEICDMAFEHRLKKLEKLDKSIEKLSE